MAASLIFGIIFSVFIQQVPQFKNAKIAFRSDEKPTFVIQLPKKKLSLVKGTLASDTDQSGLDANLRGNEDVILNEMKDLDSSPAAQNDNKAGAQNDNGTGDEAIGSQDDKVEIPNGTVAIGVKDNAGNETEVESNIEQISDNQVQITLNEEQDNSIKPGKYTLETQIEQNGKTYNLTQDFTWGVLAINFDKSSYKIGDTTNIGIGVLSDSGKTLCDAKVWLKITNPNGQATNLSTENKTITISSTCANGNVTNIPDYLASYIPELEGNYQIELKAETINGPRSITESFNVTNNPDFVITRHDTSMRIYPSSTYTINIEILANKDLSGGVKEKVPASFDISNISTGGEITAIDETAQTISWPASLKAGESIKLSYDYKAPNISPEFYLLGPIEIWQPVIEAESGVVKNTTIFSEPRAWQIAADAVIAQYSGGLLVYADTVNVGTPKYKTFDDTTGFGAEQSASSVGAAAISWIKVAASPVADTWIIATKDTANVINAQVCSGVDGGVSCGAATTINASGGAPGLRNFDVAYEGSTGGEAILVYGTSTVDALRYIKYSGGSWTGDAAITTTRTGGTVEWVELTTRTNSDQIGIAYSDDADDVSAYRWDGSAVADEATAVILATASAANVRKFDIGFENAGDMVVVVPLAGTSAGTDYAATLSGTTWTTGLSATTPDMQKDFIDIVDNNPSGVRLGAMGHGVLGASNTEEVINWTGSAIADTAATTLDDATATVWAANYMETAASYASSTYHAVFVFSQSNDDINWGTMTSVPAFAEQTDNTRTRGTIRFNKLYDYPNANKVLLISSDSASDLWADSWDTTTTGASAWTDRSGGATLEGSLASATTDVSDFAFRLAPSTITVSGGCFTNAGEGTPCTDGGASDQIKVAVNGVLDAGSDGTVDGSWTFTIPQPASGAILTFFRDGAPTAAEKATTVVKYDGDGGNVTLVKMYQSMLVIGADATSDNSDQTIINSDLDTTGNGYEYSDDAVGNDPIYGINTGVLTVDEGANLTETLYIISGDTYRPDLAGGDTVTTHHLYFEGTYTTDNNTTNVAGNWTNAGTMTATTGTVVFNGTAAAQTIISNAVSFYLVTFNNSSGTDPNINYTGALTVGNNTTLSNATRIASTNNTAITFSGTINGANILTINSGSGTVTFGGIIGGSTPITSLASSGSGAVAINTTGITTRDIASNNVSFTGAVTLGGNLNITTDNTTNDGTIIFSSTINDAYTMTLTAGGGTITLSGAIGGTTPITSLAATSTAGITLSGNVTTRDVASNTVTLTGPVSLGGGVTITTDNTTNDGAVSLTSTLNSTDATDRAFSIVAGSADVTISGTIGATFDLASLTITANDITLANIGAAGAGVTGATSITSTDGGDTGVLTLGGTVYNTNAATYVGGASGGISITGASAAFTTTADNIIFTNTTTLGNISAVSVTTAGSAPASGDITFGTIRGNTDEDVTLNASSANVTVGAIGTANEINTVAVTGATITLNGNITTSDAAGNTVTLTGNVALGAAVAISTNDTTNDGAVSITGTINNGQIFSIDTGTVDITVGGAIGASTALTSLTLTGNDISIANIGNGGAGVTGATAVTATTNGGDTGTLTFAGSTYKANAQTYAAAAGNNLVINAGAATTFTSTDDAIAFNTATVLLANGSDFVVTSAGGAITIVAIDGNSSEDVTLSSTGGSTNTVSVGAIGTGVADGINTVAITGSTSTTLTGNITTSNATGNTVTVTGPLLLGANVVITTDAAAFDGAVNLTSAVDSTGGARTFSVVAGGADITITGATGNGSALSSLTTTGNNITLANVGGAAVGVSGATAITGDATGTITLTGTVYKTTGTQAFNAGGATRTITLNEAATFTTTNTPIDFTGVVNSQGAETNAVTLAAGSAQVTFNNNVGATQSLGVLEKQGSGDVLFGTKTLTATGLTLTLGTINNAATDSGAWTVSGDVTISAGTLKATSNTLSVGGNWANSATFTAGSGTVNFTKAATSQTLTSGGTGAGYLFNNLTHSGAGTLQLITNAIDVNGIFTNSNGTFDANDFNMNVADDFLISGGSFSADVAPGATTQTVTFDGTNEATISGLNVFNNLTMNTTTDGAKTIKFPTGLGSKQTINGTWTLDGAVGKVLTLRSVSDATAWEFVIPADINPAGDYIDVKDSQNNSNAYRITAGANYTDSTNNVPGWLFPSSNTNPDPPATLTQKNNSDVSITESAWTNSNTPKLGFTITDPDVGDTVKYELQLATDSGFTSLVLDYTHGSLSASGTTFTFIVGTYTGGSCSGTCPATLSDSSSGYWWRVKAIDNSAAESAYVEFGVAGTMDFKVDATIPTGGAVYDGTSAGVDADYNTGSLTQLSANWDSFNSNISGLNKYQYAIGTTAGGTDLTDGWVDEATTAVTATITGGGNLVEIYTNRLYYFSVRAVDNAGNTSTAVNSNGQKILPQLTFTLSTNAITFDNLNNANNYNNSKTFTVNPISNAYNGFTVKAYKSQLLTSIPYPTKTIPDFEGGTYGTPGLWPAGLCTSLSNCGFGYSTSDTDIGGVDKWVTHTKFAPFTSSVAGETMADHEAAINGSTGQANDTFTIYNNVAVDSAQSATQYQTTLTFIVTANF